MPKFFLLLHAANIIIGIQHDRFKPSWLVKGFGIGQALIRISNDGMAEGVGDLFMYPRQAFIAEVNKLASCTALYLLVLSLYDYV